jgi:hypothetical protein
MGRVTLRGVTDTFYRLESDGYPLLFTVGPAVVHSLAADAEKDKPRALRIELCNEAAGSAAYEEIVAVDQTVQRALSDDERRLGRPGVLMPIVGLPSKLPSGPLFVSELLAETQFYREARGAKPDRAALADFRANCRVKVIFEIVGMRRHPERTCVWTYETVVREMLLLAPRPRAVATRTATATASVDSATPAAPAPAPEPTPAPEPEPTPAPAPAPDAACPIARELLASYFEVVESESHHDVPDVATLNRPTFE